jgi:hypothetical protein
MQEDRTAHVREIDLVFLREGRPRVMLAPIPAQHQPGNARLLDRIEFGHQFGIEYAVIRRLMPMPPVPPGHDSDANPQAVAVPKLRGAAMPLSSVGSLLPFPSLPFSRVASSAIVSGEGSSGS